MDDIKGIAEFLGFDILLVGFVTLVTLRLVQFFWRTPPAEWFSLKHEKWESILVSLVIAALAGAVLNLAADEVTDDKDMMRVLTYSIAPFIPRVGNLQKYDEWNGIWDEEDEVKVTAWLKFRDEFEGLDSKNGREPRVAQFAGFGQANLSPDKATWEVENPHKPKQEDLWKEMKEKKDRINGTKHLDGKAGAPGKEKVKKPEKTIAGKLDQLTAATKVGFQLAIARINASEGGLRTAVERELLIVKLMRALATNMSIFLIASSFALVFKHRNWVAFAWILFFLAVLQLSVRAHWLFVGFLPMLLIPTVLHFRSLSSGENLRPSYFEAFKRSTKRSVALRGMFVPVVVVCGMILCNSVLFRLWSEQGKRYYRKVLYAAEQLADAPVLPTIH